MRGIRNLMQLSQVGFVSCRCNYSAFCVHVALARPKSIPSRVYIWQREADFKGYRIFYLGTSQLEAFAAMP